MLTKRIFRPTMMAGIVYAREVGSNLPLAPIGGIESLTISIDETEVKQANFSSSGGGNRAVVYRINAMTLNAKLQDLNPVNIARSIRAIHTEVEEGTVTAEVQTARRGGLIRLAHLNPSAVALTTAADAAITMAGNYEVRPEGLWIYDDAPDIVEVGEAGMSVKVAYAHSGYDVLEALTRAAPILEMSYSGVNEAMDEAASVVDFYRCQQSATKGLDLISGGAFATLDIEAEVLQDPSKTGSQVSKYFKKRMFKPTEA